jgi:hypothetical protein
MQNVKEDFGIHCSIANGCSRVGRVAVFWVFVQYHTFPLCVCFRESHITQVGLDNQPNLLGIFDTGRILCVLPEAINLLPDIAGRKLIFV